jgi:hypothetical protein
MKEIKLIIESKKRVKEKNKKEVEVKGQDSKRARNQRTRE